MKRKPKKCVTIIWRHKESGSIMRRLRYSSLPRAMQAIRQRQKSDTFQLYSYELEGGVHPLDLFGS